MRLFIFLLLKVRSKQYPERATFYLFQPARLAALFFVTVAARYILYPCKLFKIESERLFENSSSRSLKN
jgi:hypothetical protein